MEVPLQRVLFDFDIRSPSRQSLGGDPINLSGIPTEDVRSLVTTRTVVTIVAHQGDGQDLADLLHQRPYLIAVALSYAGHHREPEPRDVALHALSREELHNIERTTSLKLPQEGEEQP